MKSKSIYAALLLAVAGMQSAFAQVVTLHFADRPAIEYSLDKVDSILFTDMPTIVDSHEYVDLGLPSGTLWATTNVGADNPEDYGTYFAWGETETKEEYSWSTYSFYARNDMYEYMTAYNTDDGKTELEANHDAATVNWNSFWQTPLDKQFAELIDTCYTTSEWTTLNNVNGWLITSKQNGKSIFLPAAGSIISSSFRNRGTYGNYWSRSLNTTRNSYANYLNFASNNLSVTYTIRYHGLTIRPIRVPLKPYDWPVKSITLNKTELELGRTLKGQLTATVLPTYAKNTSVTWESSDESVATVSEGGTVVATGIGTCTITCRSTETPDIKAECIVTVPQGSTTNGHEWVDLGLPSGTLWATTNIGADNPEDYGNYYAWGERQTKEVYSWDKYSFNDDNDLMTRYCTDSNYGNVDYKTWLQPSDDVATSIWRTEWQMPSREQFEELLDSRYTTMTWTTRNNVMGWLIESKVIESCSIFLPAAGIATEDYHNGEAMQNYYWTRTLDIEVPSGAYCFYTYEESVCTVLSIQRRAGCSVRPVRKQDVKLVTGIELSQTTLCIDKGENAQLYAYVTPEDAQNTDVVWVVTKGTAASVTTDGLLTGNSSGTCTVTAFAADGSGTRASCRVTVVGDLCPDGNHPHAIDLGLPSGTKWSCCNVGASYPSSFGGYYAWGELTGNKTNYTRANYTYYNSSTDEYTDIGTDIAGTQYDAATSVMGAPWRMPTKAQMEELISNCTYTYYEFGGSWTGRGCIMTGKNGNQIFLRAAGEMMSSSSYDAYQQGYYWSSMQEKGSSSSAYMMNILDWTIRSSIDLRYKGLSIRAVRP